METIKAEWVSGTLVVLHGGTVEQINERTALNRREFEARLAAANEHDVSPVQLARWFKERT